jgi:hypothetical protein
MKRILLKSVPDPRFAAASDPQYEVNRVDYRMLIEQALRIPFDRSAGASIDEMRKAIRVLDSLEASDLVLVLEDADWEFLLRKVERMPWAVIDRRFVRFYDDVAGATESVSDPAQLDGVTS